MKITAPLAALLAISALAAAALGMNRSFWLDEAWVANSVAAPNLGGMFYYPEWLQTSPPLFLLFARAVVKVFGLSNALLRAVPLALYAAALAATWMILRRTRFALLGFVLVAFHPAAMEQARTFKQYSGELAASAILLCAAAAFLKDQARFPWLLAATVLAIPLAYASAFLLPGIVLVAAIPSRKQARKQAAFLCGLAGVVGVPLYFAVIQPNYSPELRAFWAASAETRPGVALVAALAFAVVMGMRALAKISDFKNQLQLICALPPILFAVAAGLGWYPSSPRTRLFLLPAFAVLAVIALEEIIERLPRRATPPGQTPPVRLGAMGAIQVTTAAAIAATLAFAAFGIWRGVHSNQPFEDLRGAVRYLRDHVAPTDTLLIHPSAREGFRLYSRIDGWTTPQPLYGDTGWPCCARGHNALPGLSREADVIRDLDAKIPRTRGRVWLLFTTRPPHWDYVGLKESEVWRKHLWERGCPPGEYVALANVAVSSMLCPP